MAPDRHNLQQHRSEDSTGADVTAGWVSIADGSGNLVWDDGSGIPGVTSVTDGAWTAETQNVQSRRYLMQDGTFRDPLISGTGTISVGSITTITDDSKYNAWPSIIRIRDNKLLLVYTKGDTHHLDNTGKAVGKIGSEAPDGTITWGTEFTIYDDPSVWASAVGVTMLSTGRIIVSGFYGAQGSDPLDGAYVVYSDDQGTTWSSLIVVNASLTSYSYGSGRCLELPDGSVLQCVEGKNSGDTFSRMVVLKSTDQGATWGSQVTIATGTRDYFEACLGLLDNDTIQVLLRTSDASGDIYRSTSTDFGATWSSPSLAFAGHGQPNWCQLSTKTVIAITRENDGTGQGDVWAYTSTDRGATWSSATTLDGTMYEMEYGCPIELLDGRVLVVYGYQPSSSTSNADIKQVYVTETTAGVSGLSDHTHAATGTGSNGGGATLAPMTFTFPGTASPAQTAEGEAKWDTDDDVLTVGTGAARKTFGYLGSTTPSVESGSGSAGSGNEVSRANHVHPLSSSGGIGEILISDTPSTPLVFADLIQNEAQDDLVYADP